MNLLRRLRGDESGSAALEAIVSLTTVFSLAFWLLELSMMAYTCNVLNDAVHEGVRYAIIHGSDSTRCSGPDKVCTDKSPYTNVQSVVTTAASASLHNMSAMQVTVSYPDSSAAPGDRVSVTVTYTYIPYINLPGLKKAMTFSSQGRILF